MNVQQLIQYLQDQVQQGKLDPEMNVVIFDGGAQFLPIKEEGISIIEADDEGSAHKFICLNEDTLMASDEVEEEDFDTLGSIETTKHFLQSAGGVISLLKPKIADFGIISLAGLAAFNGFKTNALNHASDLCEALDGMLSVVQFEKQTHYDNISGEMIQAQGLGKVDLENLQEGNLNLNNLPQSLYPTKENNKKGDKREASLAFEEEN